MGINELLRDKDLKVTPQRKAILEVLAREKKALDANQLFAQDADVVFQIAGLTGAGVLEAAKEQGKYAIGVDSNQNHIQPGHVVTSALKNFGNVVFSTFEDIVNGTYVPGETKVYGLKEGGVGLAIDEYTEEILPAEIIEEIRAIEDKIRAGELTIERYPGRVQN